MRILKLGDLHQPLEVGAAFSGILDLYELYTISIRTLYNRINDDYHSLDNPYPPASLFWEFPHLELRGSDRLLLMVINQWSERQRAEERMRMHYPDEAEFEETPFAPEDFTEVADVEYIRDWFREHRDEVAAPQTDFWDWILRVMGMRMGTTFLWFGQPFLVVDDRNWGRSLGVENLSTRCHTEESIENLDRLFLDWTDENVVPAVNTGEWVERRDANQKMYGLFATDEQDPNDYYFLYGGPVSVNTAGRSREEILDVVITKVTDQYTIEFDILENEVFVAEIGNFPE